MAWLLKRLQAVDGKVRVVGDHTGLRIIAAAADGKQMSVHSDEAKRRAVMIKLLRGKLLVDALALPPRTTRPRVN